MPKRHADPKLEQRWRQRLAQWRRSGLTIRRFCEQHALSQPSFYAWRRELQRRDARRAAAAAPTDSAATPFVPVQVVPAPTPSPLELVLCGGRILRVTPGFDTDTLRRLLATLDAAAEGSSC
jgi:transposase-like protein